MDFLIDLYSTQPFWLWLAVAVVLLAIEASLSTEWLLWPAVAAGVVAVLTAIGLPGGLLVEIAVFAVLTIVATVLSSRLIKRVNPPEPDINARDHRLIGQSARVVQPFVNGRGRVFVSGAEWNAVLATEAAGRALAADDTVTVQAYDGGTLSVSPRD